MRIAIDPLAEPARSTPSLAARVASWLAAACACATTPPPVPAPTPPPSAVPAPPAPIGCTPRYAARGPDASTILVDVQAELPAAERAAYATTTALFVSWLAPAEAAALRDQGHVLPASLVPLVARGQIFDVDPQRLASGEPVRCPLAVTGDPKTAVPVVVHDHLGAFWPTVMGHPRSNLVGVAPGPSERGASSVLLRPREAAPPQKSAATPWHCDGERFRHLVVAAPQHGDGVHVCAYLPPDYATARRRTYPVVYLFAGLGGDELTRLRDRAFLARADALADAGQPAILVGVDTRSPAGSWYFGPGDAHGHGAALDAVIAAIDGTFRVTATRGVLGVSTGGFNAIDLAMTRPGLFSAVAAAVPDALDLDAWLLAADGALRPEWLAWFRLEDAVGGPGQMRSYAAAWSPADAPWPADLATGAARPDVLTRWLDRSPARRLDAPAAQDALRGLAGRLWIVAAERDEFGLFEPARRFAAALTARSIPHTFRADPGGHFDGDRPGDLLELLVRALPRPRR